jgi:ribonuclease R
LAKAGVGALFRIHERPDPQKVEEFSELAASLGYRLPANLEAVRPEDFQLILRQIAGKPEERLVSSLLLRTMQLARYHQENLGHFGLASEMYAHFTSPIRRYPDLVVHRALRALRRGQAVDEAARERLPEKKVRFMADKVGETFTGYVTGVQAFGLFVELEEIYVQGLVHVSSMRDDYYQFDEKRHQLQGENTQQVYRLGDKVQVQLARADLERRQLDFALVDVLERAARAVQAAPRKPSEARGRRRR